MKNKTFKFVSGLLFLWTLIFPNAVFAMKINEIMYDVVGTDTGREWVEIYNDTSSPIDFSSWKFLENSVNHTVKLISGSPTIPAGGFAILADNDVNFMLDNPDFVGTLFDSAFSLTNTGETLTLVDPSGNKIDEISYNDSLGAKGDGNSLQLHEGFLITALPTIAKQNSTESSLSVSSSTIITTSSITISSHSSSVSVSNLKEEADFEVSIGRDRMSSIKTPIKFEARIKDDNGFKRTKYLWSFGDGRQQKGNNINYSYKNEGIYNVVLNAVFGDKHAVSRAVINVIKPKVKFGPIEEGLEFFNLDSKELNIGGWKVKSEDKMISFVFPQDTIISPNNKIIFDKELFVEEDKIVDFSEQKLNLLFPNGDILNQ